MEQNGYLTVEQQQAAVATPVQLTERERQEEEAPYFLALARQELGNAR